MSRRLKVGIYHPDGDEPTLLTALLDIEGLRVVGQWDGAANLSTSVHQSRPDVLAALLNGPSASKILDELCRVAKENPNLFVLGVGLPNDPHLLREAMRAKLTELLDLPVQPERLLTALQVVAERHAARPSGRLIAVRGTGGGCGATTLAVNLAVELAKRDVGRVVIVDLDFRYGQVTTMFDMAPAFTVAELAMQSGEYDERVFDSALAKHDSGVLVLARPRDPENANVSLVKMSAILNSLLEYYEWVIVDGIDRSDMTSRVVQDLADEYLLVTQLAVTNIRNATQILAGLGPTFKPERLRVIVNRVPKKPGTVTVEKLCEAIKRPAYATIWDDPDSVMGAINMGIPLAQHAADSKARQSIRDLAAQLSGAASQTPTKGAKPSVVSWLKDRLKSS